MVYLRWLWDRDRRARVSNRLRAGSVEVLDDRAKVQAHVARIGQRVAPDDRVDDLGHVSALDFGDRLCSKRGSDFVENAPHVALVIFTPSRGVVLEVGL